ncbi:MAG: DUF3024 domain-containing protein [Dactylosporangium sp.]|nr:DUF3024 domain-containing protein [Dactylosporangium sp.]
MCTEHRGPAPRPVTDRDRPYRSGRSASRHRLPIARLTYTKTRRTWQLYYRDRNLRFHRYDQVPPTATIADLLDEIERDPTGIFWG